MSTDSRAIENLIARYALLVDTGDFEGVGELLADATFIGSGEPAVGGAAIAARPLAPIASGRYRDTFTRHNGQWKLTERRVSMPLRGDVSHHLRG